MSGEEEEKAVSLPAVSSLSLVLQGVPFMTSLSCTPHYDYAFIRQYNSWNTALINISPW